MVVEIAKVFHSGAVCDPNPFLKIAQVIPIKLSPQMMHVMDSQRPRQENNRSDSSLTFQTNADSRSLLYIVFFHDMNALGTIIANIMDTGK